MSLCSFKFVSILDRTKKRTQKVEFIVVHTTNYWKEGGTAINNAKCLARDKSKAVHWYVDDSTLVKSLPETEVAYAIGGNIWRGFVPKWRKNKIKPCNGNTLNIEMCLNVPGIDNNAAIDNTTRLIAVKCLFYGLDTSRVIRHYEVTGKTCTWFYPQKGQWIAKDENKKFYEMKRAVQYCVNEYRKGNKELLRPFIIL